MSQVLIDSLKMNYSIDAFILKHSAHQVSENFFLWFGGEEVFLPVAEPMDEAEPKVRLAWLEDHPMVLCYASRDDARLGSTFIGLSLAEAAKMVCQLPDVDGILIQSTGDAWLIGRKEALRNITTARPWV